MLNVQRIANLELPELAPYRTLKFPREHRVQGIFVAEGDKVVHRLLATPIEIVSVLIPEHRWPEYEPALTARREDINVFCVTDKSVLEALIGYEMFQGVMAVAKIPLQSSLAELLRTSPSPRLFVAADGLANAENIGVLARNCVAFGAQALLVGETSASPYLRRAVRNSMGTIFQLPVHETVDLAETLVALKSHQVHCLAAHPHTEQRSLAQADFSRDCCIVFGSEGQGLSPKVLAACDEAVAIPMPPNVDSLNVASAAAVFLYEAMRQRGEPGKC